MTEDYAMDHASLVSDGSHEIEVGKIYSIKSPFARSAKVVKVTKVQSQGSGARPVAIVFGQRIKIQSRKYRASNAVTDRDFFSGDTRVYSGMRADFIETTEVQGHSIPAAYALNEDPEITEAIRTGLAKGITSDVERGKLAVHVYFGTLNGSPEYRAHVAYDVGFLDGESNYPLSGLGERTEKEIRFLVSPTRIHVREIVDGEQKWFHDTPRIAAELGVKVEWNALEIPR